jgi:hypothetical protein
MDGPVPRRRLERPQGRSCIGVGTGVGPGRAGPFGRITLLFEEEISVTVSPRLFEFYLRGFFNVSNENAILVSREGSRAHQKFKSWNSSKSSLSLEAEMTSPLTH